MLDKLKVHPEDSILVLMGLYNSDPRPGKLDLGVGVYKNADGITPVMRAVKAAEHRLWETETTKTYTRLSGDPDFSDAMRDLVLGDAVDPARVAAAATPGGTGAIRQALELIQGISPDATVWTSAPTWPNHLAIMEHLGVKQRDYRYFEPETGGVDFDGMMADLKRVVAGDVVLLHGCCHNPTGANLTGPEWRIVADHLASTGAIPFIDIAYQGFGDGLDADAAGTRLIAATCPEVLIAASCSKNFGIYRERAGLLFGISADAGGTAAVQSTFSHLNRQAFSFPPDHGARVVTTILNDPALRTDWQAELEETRLNMLALREQLADELRRATGSDRFGFLAQHRGMFSRLGTTPEKVEAMRRDHGIYMVSDSRMNIAGLNAQTVPVLAKAIAAAGV